MTLPLPSKIQRLLDNEPRIAPGHALFMDGFRALTRDRQIGFGVAPIPYRSIAAYVDHHGISEDPDLMHAFEHIVIAIDNAWCAWQVDHVSTATRSRPEDTDSGDARRRGRGA